MRIRVVFPALLAVTARLAGQNPLHAANGAAKEQAAAPSTGTSVGNRTRLGLNLPGKENTAGGEGRRNEAFVKFNYAVRRLALQYPVDIGGRARRRFPRA